MKKLNLQMFTGYSLTAYKDAGVTSVTLSADSGLAKDDEVTCTIVLETGKELANIECISGGATVTLSTKKVKMGAADAVIYVTSKDAKRYKVVESTIVNVNGSRTELTRNMMIVHSANGAVADVSCSGTVLSLSDDMIASLVASGAIIKM